MFVFSVFTWRSTAQVWHCSPLSTSSWFSADLLYAASLKTPFPGFLLPGICMSQVSPFKSAVVNRAKGKKSGTFDRVWTECLCGAAHLSARGKARSAQWRTWWSHSRAHSLWAWSLETTGNGHRVGVLITSVSVSVIIDAHLASTRIWQKVGHRSKDPRAISQKAGGSLYLLDPSQTLGPHSHLNSSSFPGRQKRHKDWRAEH